MTGEMRASLDNAAQADGMSVSEYLRAMIARELRKLRLPRVAR